MKENQPNGAVCRPPTIGIDGSRANRPDKTGVERYAHDLINELKTVIPPSHRVLLYSAEPLTGQLADLPGNWESRVLAWPPRRLWTQLRLAWEMWRRPPDLLFVPAHVLPPILPAASAVTVHDVGFMALPELYRPAEQQFQAVATARAARRATTILTVSEFSKSELVRHFPAAAGKVTVTPLACDQERFRPLDPSVTRPVLERFGLVGDGRPYFLYIGRLEEKKNLSGLLQGFRAFHERFAPSLGVRRLVLVGPRGFGYEQAKAEALVGAPGAADQVRELGYVSGPDQSALKAGAESFVFPSRYEGFGIPVLEAFAGQTPVIASRIGALTEVAGQAAEFVDIDGPPERLAEAMARLASDPARRAELIAAGQRRLEDFSWRKTAELTWAALAQALRQAKTCD